MEIKELKTINSELKVELDVMINRPRPVMKAIET